MKIKKLENGNVELTALATLMIYGNTMTGSRPAQQTDDGRLFALTATEADGSVTTNIRLVCTGARRDGKWERQKERELLQNPVRHFGFHGSDMTETYLGRVWVAEVSASTILGGNSPVLEARTELSPFTMPPMNWDSYWDGQEMMELASKAGVERQVLLAATAGCARLALHLAGWATIPRQAVEAVEKWSRGLVSDDVLEMAVFDNRAAHDRAAGGRAGRPAGVRG